ncbi:CRP-like cAMP-binding protein [Kibdelosporangium banguiense]|uniref:CRP-like cAMP-binding protein n=1 Tax=Kibdelosporangium banguiense TaxID=1365924 RepID=A0ABS4THD4_9PSEU|nr:Crp/Fnr family transcriptional regulator [Kibdelosporangium banguiense]MBP2323409.1 CRP-like cAMP-binding protein [Kibdelosporangium banguiense]
MDTGQDSFWGRLAPAEREALEVAAARRRYAAGDYLCHEGDQTKHVIVVLSGHVQVISHTTDDREVVIAVRSAGDIVGEMAALYDQPRSATLQALDNVEAITLLSDRFTHLCQTRAKLTYALLGVVHARFGELNRQRAEYGGGSASRRVFAQLVQMAVQYGQSNGTGIEIKSGWTQQQLADNAATSRESYARALRSLRERGIITTGRGWIRVHRLDELRRLAH